MTAIRDNIITSRLSLKRSFRGHLIIMPSLGRLASSGPMSKHFSSKLSTTVKKDLFLRNCNYGKIMFICSQLKRIIGDLPSCPQKWTFGPKPLKGS